MNSRNDDGSELGVLAIALLALAAVIAFLVFTESDGAEPVPLPTAPTTVAP